MRNDSCSCSSSSSVSKIPLKVSIIQPSSQVIGPNVKADTETISKKRDKECVFNYLWFPLYPMSEITQYKNHHLVSFQSILSCTFKKVTEIFFNLCI